MIRAKELGGRAVVDVDAAEKLGKIDRLVIDPESRRVAGFVVSRGSSIFNNEKDILLPASCVHAVGPDAVTVRGAAADAGGALDNLPRVSDLTGRKVVSDQGRMLGTVDDVLIDETDGRIVGYALAGSGLDDKLQNLVSGERPDARRGGFLRAEANLRAGQDLIVAPEDAVSYDWDTLDARDPGAGGPVRHWPVDAPAATPAASAWLRKEAAVRPLDKKIEEP